jgi:hypothetical protein
MPWAWVVVGLVVWMIAALLVIALCTSVRRIDARLARGRTRQLRRGGRAQAGAGADVE